MKVLRATGVALGLPLILFAVWWIASVANPSFYFPPLPQLLKEFPETWGVDMWMSDVIPSLLRLFASYAVALLVGIGLGTVLGLSRTIRLMLEPVLEFLRAVPPTALVPVVMLFFGIGDVMKIVVIVLGCLWPILLNTIEGVRSVDEVLSDTAATYHVRGRSRLSHLVLRSASPQIFTGARQALSIGIIMMVISEMFAASNGIGFAIVQFQHQFSIPEMWSGVILLGIIGYLLSQGFAWIERRSLAWYHGLKVRSEIGG